MFENIINKVKGKSKNRGKNYVQHKIQKAHFLNSHRLHINQSMEDSSHNKVRTDHNSKIKNKTTMRNHFHLRISKN